MELVTEMGLVIYLQPRMDRQWHRGPQTRCTIHYFLVFLQCMTKQIRSIGKNYH